MNDEEKLNNWLNKKDIPEVIITPPKKIESGSCYEYDTYDYSKSHIIYRDYDLGSLEELKAMKEENKKLRQWDCNKDSRNSRQRVANKKLIKDNERLKKQYCERMDCAARLGESKKVEELKSSVKYYVDVLTDLKKWLEEDEEKAMMSFEAGKHFNYKDVLNKIKELEEKNNAK